jgi:8-oxo-dGTP pyrophosphatase MutT (NUDIX family)
MTTTHRVRAILTKDFGELMLIKRQRADGEPYWVFPGGGVEENDSSPESALLRELFEELGATAEILSLPFVLERQTAADVITKESFYLCRLLSQDVSLRTGPEFADASRGTYELEWIELEPSVLNSTNIKPEETKVFLIQHGQGIRAIPDLRATSVEDTARR